MTRQQPGQQHYPAPAAQGSEQEGVGGEVHMTTRTILAAAVATDRKLIPTGSRINVVMTAE